MSGSRKARAGAKGAARAGDAPGAFEGDLFSLFAEGGDGEVVEQARGATVPQAQGSSRRALPNTPAASVDPRERSPLPQEDKPAVLSVSEALSISKDSLERIRVSVEGEISECSDKAGYKAVYFTLTDKSSALPCMMWKNEFAKFDIRLRQGMMVQVRGNFTVYAAKGRMNFVAHSIKLAGEGELRMKVARLAADLEKRGLMDPARKHPPTPGEAMRIAVVTSPRGKAIHDVLRTLRRRAPQVEVYVVGVPVEGEGAPAAICEGLRVADESDADVILLVRGGGSYEDLMPFNDERVALAVAACVTPVVTGIGHEPDNSIADMVGDLRCSTPTAAAEKVTIDIELLRSSAVGLARRMSGALRHRADEMSARLDRASSHPMFRDLNVLLGPFAMRLDLGSRGLYRAIPNMLAGQRSALAKAEDSLVGIGTRMLDAPRSQIALAAAKLDGLSPLAILARGYAAAYDSSGKVLSSVSQVEVGDEVRVQVSDGSMSCTVDEVRSA